MDEILKSLQGLYLKLVSNGLFVLIPGVPAEQAAKRGGHSKVQTEKDGDLSDAEQKDEEGTAESESPNGIFASEDPDNPEMTQET